MRFFPLLAPALFVTLAACQSCKKPVDPAKPPTPPADASTKEDASAAVLDAGAPEVKDAAVETGVDSGPSRPVNPCWGGIVGPANAFCEGDAPTMVAVEPRLPDSKRKLYFAMSAATDRTRLVVRYANGSQASKFRTAVVLVNKGPAAGSLTLLKKGVAGPTTNLPEGEALAAQRWASSSKKLPVQVGAGKSVKFDPSLEVGLQKDYATMGLYEYSFDQPHTVFVCFLGPTEDSSVCPGLSP